MLGRKIVRGVRAGNDDRRNAVKLVRLKLARPLELMLSQPLSAGALFGARVETGHFVAQLTGRQRQPAHSVADNANKVEVTFHT